jgi:hypothetical protein
VRPHFLFTKRTINLPPSTGVWGAKARWQRWIGKSDLIIAVVHLVSGFKVLAGNFAFTKIVKNKIV